MQSADMYAEVLKLHQLLRCLNTSWDSRCPKKLAATTHTLDCNIKRKNEEREREGGGAHEDRQADRQARRQAAGRHRQIDRREAEIPKDYHINKEIEKKEISDELKS